MSQKMTYLSFGGKKKKEEKIVIVKKKDFLIHG